MNRLRAKELLPIIEAFANGEEIQFRDAAFAMVDSRELDWIDLPKFTSTFPCVDYEYRIKPKPREWEVLVSYDGYSLTIRADGERNWIKVREVLE